MLILHVADIHFRHPECATQMDPDRPYRTALIREVRERVVDLGPVDAILVGGDIAFRGIAEEYEIAIEWFTELAAAAGCTLSDVFVVPGNHDVNRDTIRRQATIRNAQRAIFSARPERRERELFVQLQDSNAGPSLFAALDAYNKFAARFNCQVYAPDKLFWHQERALGPMLRVRFYGLTSTLLSGAGAYLNEEDTRESLYLSPYQTAFDPLDGVVNVVLCHHPPDWFMDHDNVDDAINGRATLQLFGHKHRQRLHRDMAYVRFSAGAVSPDRNEPGWEPGFNFIKLDDVSDAGGLFLNVTAHLLSWQTNPDRFRPKLTDDGQQFFTHRIRLRGVPHNSPPEVNPEQPAMRSGGSMVSTAGLSPSTTHRSDGEVAMSEPQTRNLVLRFWSLASSQRREIAQRLGLITEGDMKLPEPERYGRALLRANELGLLGKIADEVSRAEEGKR